MINTRFNIHVNNIVRNYVRRNTRVSIISSKQKPFTERQQYKNYTKVVNKMFDELANDMIYQVESCAYDYPDDYVCLSITSPEGHEIVHIIHTPEI
jgi:hypothetical protein